MREGAGTWDQLLSVTSAQLAKPASAGAKPLPLAHLRPNPNQPRAFFDEAALDELAASLTVHGVLQPLVVRPHPTEAGRYEIVAGERRFRAAGRAGLTEVPAIVKAFTDAEALEVALIENLQREDVSPLEEARTLQRLMAARGYSLAQLGEKLGKNKAYVDHRVRLLKMPADVQAALERTERKGETLRFPFSPRHAGIAVQIKDPAAREALIRAVFAEELSVAAALKRKDAWLEKQAPVPAPAAAAPELAPAPVVLGELAVAKLLAAGPIASRAETLAAFEADLRRLKRI